MVVVEGLRPGQRVDAVRVRGGFAQREGRNCSDVPGVDEAGAAVSAGQPNLAASANIVTVGGLEILGEKMTAAETSTSWVTI